MAEQAEVKSIEVVFNESAVYGPLAIGHSEERVGELTARIVSALEQRWPGARVKVVVGSGLESVRVNGYIDLNLGPVVSNIVHSTWTDWWFAEEERL